MSQDEHCQHCQFRLVKGMRIYRVGPHAYCQRCVRGPFPVGDSRFAVLPLPRISFENVLVLPDTPGEVIHLPEFTD